MLPPADLQYLLWFGAVLNIVFADIAFNFETHDKNLKCWQMRCNTNVKIFFQPVLAKQFGTNRYGFRNPPLQVLLAQKSCACKESMECKTRRYLQKCHINVWSLIHSFYPLMFLFNSVTHAYKATIMSMTENHGNSSKILTCRWYNVI